MRQILLFAALAASLALLAGCTLSKTKKDTEDVAEKAAYHKISAEEAYKMMTSQEVVVVDVRTREEYDGGHIENAVLVPNESIGRCSRTRAHSIWLKRSALHTFPLLTALSIRRSACST